MMEKRGLRGTIIAAIAMSAVITSCAAGFGQEPNRKVLYIVPTLDDAAYVSQTNAAKKKAQEYPDIEFEFTAGIDRHSATDIISKIEDGVTRGVDLIVVDPAGLGEQLTPALRSAVKAGVKVVTNSVSIPTFEGTSARIEFDSRAGAKPGGEYMASHLKPGDQVAILRCAIGHPQMDGRENGFRDGLEGSGIEVVATAETHCDLLEGRKAMENWITVYPNLKGVLSDTDLALLGAIQAMKAANRDLVTVGHDASPEFVKKIRDGDVADASPVYPYWAFGAIGVETAARILAGEKVPEHVVVPIEGLVTKENAQGYLNKVAAYGGS